jgi:NTP pyrophosphatase (non-canonical NTP hydrolase)
MNLERCQAKEGFDHAINSWSTNDWIIAVMGELGEAANIQKKINRARDGVKGNTESEDILESRLIEELADTFIYLDLLFHSLHVDAMTCVMVKFEGTSRKIGFSKRTPERQIDD